MNPPELLTSKEDFERLRGEASSIIDLTGKLPDVVFKKQFYRYYAVEHGHTYKEEFGAFLAKLSQLFGDLFVNYMTLEPDPVEYYYRRLSFYGLASFTSDSVASRYHSVMYRNGKPESFITSGGDRGCFWGSSLNWGIVCDRISWEIVVIAVAKPINVSEISGFRCMDSSWLRGYMKSQYSHNPEVGEQFTNRFLQNYPVK